MMAPTLAFAAGLSAFCFLPLFLLPFIGAGALIVSVFCLRLQRSALAVFLCLGIGIGAVHRLNQKPLDIPDRGFYNGVVTVSGFPEKRTDGQYEVAAENGRLKIVSPDAYAFYRTQKIEAAGFVRGRAGSRVQLYLKDFRTVDPGIGLFRLVSRLRKTVADRMDSVGNPVSRALLSAMILGNPDFLGFEALQVFRMTGLTHLLAVSGLNVAILAASVLAVCGLFLNRRMSFLVAAAAVLAYAGAAGCSASILRASVMFLVYSGLKILGRPADLLDAIVFSAVPVLAFDPGFLSDIGFWLSYGAVFGITFFARTFRDVFFPAVRFLSEGASVTLAASLPTLPVQLFFFGGFSPYFLLSNLVAVPVFTLVTYLVFAELALLVFPFGPLLGAADFVLNALWTVCLRSADLVSRLPFGFLTLPEGQNAPAAAVAALPLLAAILFRQVRFSIALRRIRKLAAETPAPALPASD